MDPLGERIRLFEVNLLSDASQGALAPLAGGDSSAELPLGKLVTARVVDASPGSTLANIGGKPYALNMPFPVHAGQLLNLQVSQVQPTLQFRLLADSRGTMPQSQDLGAFHPDVDPLPLPAPSAQALGGAAPLGSDPSPANAGAKQPGIESELSRGVPLVSTTETVAAVDLGGALAVQIKRRFEEQAPAPPLKAPPSTSTPSSEFGFRQDSTFDEPMLLRTGSALLAHPPESASPGTAPMKNPSSLASIPPATASSPSNPVASALEPAAWTGHVWAGQTASITLEPDQRQAPFEAPALNRWNATLKLTLPQLGQIHAKVDWSTPGLSIRIAASEATSAELLRNRSSELLRTLRSLEMRVQAIGVTHGE